MRGLTLRHALGAAGLCALLLAAGCYDFRSVGPPDLYGVKHDMATASTHDLSEAEDDMSVALDMSSIDAAGQDGD